MTKAKKKDDIQELFEEYAKTHDQALRDKLIEKNLYIAEILAKKFIGKGIDYDLSERCRHNLCPYL